MKINLNLSVHYTQVVYLLREAVWILDLIKSSVGLGLEYRHRFEPQPIPFTLVGLLLFNREMYEFTQFYILSIVLLDGQNSIG